MKQLTVFQIFEIMKNNKYVIFTDFYGNRAGFNGAIANQKVNIEKAKKNAPCETRFVSWRACDFMEYITEKIGFIK